MFLKIYKSRLLFFFLLCFGSYKCYSFESVLSEMHTAIDVLSNKILKLNDDKLLFGSSYFFVSFPTCIFNANLWNKNFNQIIDIIGTEENLLGLKKSSNMLFCIFSTGLFVPISFGYLWQIGISHFFFGFGLGIDFSRYEYRYEYSRCRLKKEEWLALRDSFPLEKEKPEDDGSKKKSLFNYLNPFNIFSSESVQNIVTKETKNLNDENKGKTDINYVQCNDKETKYKYRYKIKNDNVEGCNDHGNLIHETSEKINAYVSQIDNSLYSMIEREKILGGSSIEKEIKEIKDCDYEKSENVSNYKTTNITLYVEPLKREFEDFVPNAEEEKKEEKKEEVEEKKEEKVEEKKEENKEEEKKSKKKDVNLGVIFSNICNKKIFNKDWDAIQKEDDSKNFDLHCCEQLDSFFDYFYSHFNPFNDYLFWEHDNKSLKFKIISIGPKISISYMSDKVVPTFGWSWSIFGRLGFQLLWDINGKVAKDDILGILDYNQYRGDYSLTNIIVIPFFVAFGFEIVLSIFQLVFEVKTFNYNKILSKLNMRQGGGYYVSSFKEQVDNNTSSDMLYRNNNKDNYEIYTDESYIRFFPIDGSFWKNFVFSVSINLISIK